METRNPKTQRNRFSVAAAVFVLGIVSGIGYIVAGPNVCDLQCEYVGTKMVCKPVNCRHENPNCDSTGIGWHPCG